MNMKVNHTSYEPNGKESNLGSLLEFTQHFDANHCQKIFVHSFHFKGSNRSRCVIIWLKLRSTVMGLETSTSPYRWTWTMLTRRTSAFSFQLLAVVTNSFTFCTVTPCSTMWSDLLEEYFVSIFSVEEKAKQGTCRQAYEGSNTHKCMLASRLTYSFTKDESGTCPSEALIDCHWSTWFRTPEDRTVQCFSGLYEATKP